MSDRETELTDLRKLIRKRERTYQAAQGSSDPEVVKASVRAERALRKKMVELWPKPADSSAAPTPSSS